MPRPRIAVLYVGGSIGMIRNSENKTYGVCRITGKHRTFYFLYASMLFQDDLQK